jgi:hypothetical protein
MPGHPRKREDRKDGFEIKSTRFCFWAINQVQAYEVYAYEAHAYEVHAYETHA